MTITEMYAYLNTDREGFSILYKIPCDTLKLWEDSEKSMPEYIGFLLERVIREDRDKIQKESRLEQLYRFLDNPVSQSKWDIEFDYLKEIKDCNGESYWVYKDELKFAAIRMSDGDIITDLSKIKSLNENESTDFEQLELDSILNAQSFL